MRALLGSLEMSISVIMTVLLFYLVFVFVRLWSTGAVLKEYDMDTESGHLLPNGDPAMLRHLLGGSSAVATMLGQQVVNASLRIRPTAAVLVPASYAESYTEDGLSSFTLNRLEQGLRMALMTGAPWLFVSGTTAECALGVEYLREKLRGAALLSLFRTTEEEDGVWIDATPDALNMSITSWSCLLHDLGASADLSTLGQVPLSFAQSESHGTVPRSAALRTEERLASFLEANPRTSAIPRSTRQLAAFLLAQYMASSADERQAAEHEDDFVVYSGRDDEGAWAAAGGVDPDTLWQLPRLWQPSAAGTCGFHAGDGDVVSLMLPGIVSVPLDGLSPDDGALANARAFRTLLERSVLSRKRLDPVDGTSWWLFNKTYSVIALASNVYTQRVQLQYQAAFRKVRFEAFADLRTAVATAAAGASSFARPANGKHGGVPAVEDILPRFLVRPTSVRGGYATPISEWSVPTPHYPDVYVLQGAEVLGAVVAKPLPGLVSFAVYSAKLRALSSSHAAERKEEGSADPFRSRNARISLLDDGVPPPDASRLALTWGWYGHYVYYNYRRQLDAFVATLCAINYCDFFTFARDFASDIAHGRIDWRDFFIPVTR